LADLSIRKDNSTQAVWRPIKINSNHVVEAYPLCLNPIRNFAVDRARAKSAAAENDQTDLARLGNRLRILIIGATGGTGRELVWQALGESRSQRLLHGRRLQNAGRTERVRAVRWLTEVDQTLSSYHLMS
jgi:hypothetical protein